jgi:hypothetical protein
MKRSLIIAMYNRRDTLDRVLAGVSRQKVRSGKILIADDGSGHFAREPFDRWQSDAGVPVRHLWHPDICGSR